MRLRSTTRLPERYLDGDRPGLRYRTAFIPRASKYNPDLPPAAFPTLVHPPTVESRAPGGTPESSPNPEEPPDDDPQRENPPKKATVFHAQNDSTNSFIKGKSPSSADFEVLDVLELESRRFLKLNSSNGQTDPREYDGWQTMANSNDTPRTGLTAYDLAQGWSRVSDDMKLILFREIMVTHSFNAAGEKLMLTDVQRNTIMSLFQREISREVKEDAKIARVQAAQLRMLMSGDHEIGREALSRSFEDLYTDIEVPAASTISKTDIQHTRRFLMAVKLDEYVNRLWRYEGVAQTHIDWNITFIEEEPADPIESAPFENQYQHLLISANAGIGHEFSPRKKNKTLLEEVGGSSSVKRKRKSTGSTKLRVPSRLRNSISYNLEDTVAIGPAASLAANIPQGQLAMQASPGSQIEKQHRIPLIRLVMRSSTKSHSLDTPIRNRSNAIKQIAESVSGKEFKQPWPLEQSESSRSQLPWKESLSQMGETRSSSSRADLGKMKNVYGQYIKDANNSAISGRERNVATAPVIKASSSMAAETTADISAYADIEIDPEIENNWQSENTEQVSASSANTLNCEPDQESIAQEEENMVPRTPRPKRRKIDGETSWRASGQRKPKYPVQEEHPVGQNRAAIRIRRAQKIGRIET